MPAHECFENNDLFCAIYGYELASEYGYEVIFFFFRVLNFCFSIFVDI